MASLKIGYDMFAGASQAGYDSGVPGVIQVETAKAEAYYCRIQELDSNEYYNHTTRAFQVADPGKSHHILIPGSVEQMPSAFRRLAFRIPEEAQAGIGAAGATFVIYANSDTAASGSESLTITFQP